MMIKPYSFISLQLSSLSNALIKESQTFAEDLLKKKRNFYHKKDSTENFTSSIEDNRNTLQEKILNWFTNLHIYEKIKVCSFQNKWLTEILLQMYLLYEKDNKIKFKPTDKMIIFFNELNSLNSFELLNNKISSNDGNNEKEGGELNSTEKKKEDIEEILNFYKTYFISIKIKDDKNNNDDYEIKNEKEFLKYIKIISLNENDFDTITINSDLLSDIEKFKSCFKYLTHDNYFKDLILIFKEQNGSLNFKMPSWMNRTNICFSFCQIIFGFLEQHILLNYEYFYYTNQIYEFSYFSKIIKIYKENQNIDKILNKKSNYFKQLFSKCIIKRIINKIKKDDELLKINKNIRDICNKVYSDKFKNSLISRNILYDSKLNLNIFDELQNQIKDENDENKKFKKLIDKLTFLNFNKIINSRQFIYMLYRKFLINYLNNNDTNILNKKQNKNKELKEEINNKIENINKEKNLKDYNKINNINAIQNIYSNKNDTDDKLVRIISNSSITTKNESEHLSIYSDDSFSLNSEKSQNIEQIKNNINNTYSPINNNNNKNIININNANNIFSNYYHFYYNKSINDYCFLTNYNLKILNNLKEQKLKLIENIINENLKDKFDITFGHYGSHFTGLSIEGSDMDICLIYKPKNNINLDFYNELKKLLLKQKPLLYNIIPISNMETRLFKIEIDITDEIKKYPLQNYFGYIDYEDLTKIKIDISINDNKEYLENCEKNVEYVKNTINNFPQIKPILLLLKRYFKKMKMNKVFYGGISSYSLFLLILNVLKSEKKENPNTQIGISQLLFLVLKKFSFFNFGYKGIGIDNYDYILGIDNFEENLYILNPLTGKNVAKGRCKGEKLKKVFYNAFNLFSFEINYFRNYFNNGFYPFNKPPINSIIALFNSKINFFS